MTLTERFACVGGLVQGRDHRRMLRDGQDGLAAREGEHGLGLAVTDGCGSALHSEVGARLGAAWLAAQAPTVLIEHPSTFAEHLSTNLCSFLDKVVCELEGSGGRSAIVGEMFLFSFGPSRWSAPRTYRRRTGPFCCAKRNVCAPARLSRDRGLRTTRGRAHGRRARLGLRFVVRAYRAPFALDLLLPPKKKGPIMLPLPSFYDPSKVSELYLERAALVADEARVYATTHGIGPANKDKLRIAAFGIDCQIGFSVPGASLFVPGAVEDTQRTLAWLYGNLDKISGLHFSLDTHRIFQIFHPSWWIAEDGSHPAPFSVISYEDVRAGVWQPVSHPAESLEYTKRLAAQGKYVLTIWPYHTLLGGVSHALVPALMEASIFHAVARKQQTHFETKGTHSLTENYSVMSPEVLELGGRSVGTFNAAFFKMLMEYDRVYVFGQAKSHCVLSTLRDMQAHVEQTEPSLIDKIYVLEDAMSPVPAPPLSPLPPELDFPRIADLALEGFARAGMHVVSTKTAVI